MASQGIIVSMGDLRSEAAEIAEQIAALEPHGIALALPMRIDFVRREHPFPADVERYRGLRRRIEAIALPRGVLVTFEGICRVAIGTKSGMRTRPGRSSTRFTAVVVHVMTKGEGAYEADRTHLVILPLE